MSVVKSLALGASILGSLVAPTLAGSIRSSHHVPDRPHRAVLPTQAPTSLVMAPVAAAAPSPVALPVAPARNAARPTSNFSQENLATLGVPTPSQSFTNYNPAGVGTGGVSATFAATGLNAATAVPTFTPAPAATAAPTFAPPVASTYVPQASAKVASAAFAATPAAAPASGPTVDAFINLGSGPFSEAQSLTSGNPQSWTQSPVVQAIYHGTPTAQQQADFAYNVIKTIQTTYNQSGLNITLSADPNSNYAHTMSVVSGASFPGNPAAIGITDVGNDGFSFIDKFGQAKTPAELASAVGHNVAHELMHAFGVSGHPDQTGSYLDAATANWSMLTSDSTKFSPEAVQLLSQQNFLNGPGKNFTQGTLGLTGLEVLAAHHIATCTCPICSSLHRLEAAEGLAPPAAATVPEPTTVALWGAIAGIAAVARRRAQRD